MKKDVLGVKIDDVTVDEVVELVEKWLKGDGKHYIVTPNPEILVMAHNDNELKNILNNADLAIPDGVGLRLGTDIVCNTPGIEVMEQLVKLAADLGFTTGFLGGRDQVAKKTQECLRKKYKNLKVTFTENGGEIDNAGNVIASPRSEARQSKKEIASSSASGGLLAMTRGVDLLFVAFGPPKQEKWIAKNLQKLDIKIAMGVGGSFDILSGNTPRAPKWIRDLGFEWLFRLIIQPWRFKRQLSLIKYIWLLTKQSF